MDEETIKFIDDYCSKGGTSIEPMLYNISLMPL